MDVLQKIEDNDPFFALDVPGMKEDIIISCSIMEKKNQNKSLFLGLLLTIFFTILKKYFPKYLFYYAQVFMNPSFMQSIRKRNNPFWIYSKGNRHIWQQHLQRKAHNVEKRYNNNSNTAY